MQLTTIEAEWVVGYALVQLGKVSPRYLARWTKMNFEEFNPFPRRSDAAFAAQFRAGAGAITDPLDPVEPDLVDEMAKLRSDPGFRLENAFRWMGIESDELTYE